MATITREQIGSLHDKITVQLVKEDYVPGFDKAMKGYAKTVQVPGFRKGMVPAGMVKKMYGPSIFNEEIIRTASKELESYLQKENLEIDLKDLVLKEQD
jgi:trigger factor